MPALDACARQQLKIDFDCITLPVMMLPCHQVPRALIVHNPLKAANQAIAAIQKIRCFKDGTLPTADEPKGVAKLGFSWVCCAFVTV